MKEHSIDVNYYGYIIFEIITLLMFHYMVLNLVFIMEPLYSGIVFIIGVIYQLYYLLTFGLTLKQNYD